MQAYNIVILYGTLMTLGWGRAQKLCDNFLKMGHHICYIQYPISFNNIFNNIINPPNKLNEINLYVIDLYGLPARRFQYLNNLNIFLIKFQLLRKLKKESLSPDILWIYGVPPVAIVDIFSPKTSIYDCADDRVSRELEMYGEREAESFKMTEDRLIEKVDHIFAVSDTLLEEIKLRLLKKDTKKVSLLNNGVDLSDFDNSVNSTYQIPDIMQNIKKPIIGYIGTKTYELDYELMLEIVKMEPNLSFVIIGNVSKEIKRLLLFKNVYYLGYIPYKMIPNYIRLFDVCIAPFKPYKSVYCADPLKVIQYFAMGKPVVSTIKLGIKEYDGLISLGSDSKSFLNAIREALKEDGGLFEKRISIAKK